MLGGICAIYRRINVKEPNRIKSVDYSAQQAPGRETTWLYAANRLPPKHKNVPWRQWRLRGILADSNSAVDVAMDYRRCVS